MHLHLSENLRKAMLIITEVNVVILKSTGFFIERTEHVQRRRAEPYKKRRGGISYVNRRRGGKEDEKEVKKKK